MANINNSTNNFRPANQVFVATNGSDTGGSGSQGTPYLTIANALASITDASSSKRYAIIIQSGQYNEATLAMKPYISLWGSGYNNTRITVTGNQVTLDGGFSGTSARSGFFNLILTGTTGIQFDLSALAAGSAVFDIWQCWINGAVNIIGRVGGSDFIQVFGSSFFGAVTYSSMNITSLGNIFNSTYTINSSASNGPSAGDSQGDEYLAAVSISNTGTNTTAYTLSSCSLQSTLTLSGSHTTVKVDVSTYIVPTISSGATLTLLSVANGLLANRTATHYITNGTDLKSNLDGIDTALAQGNFATSTTHSATATVTAADWFGGVIVCSAGATAITLTTDTAANLYSQMGSPTTVNTYFHCMIVNQGTATGTVTILGGNNVTVTMGNATIPAGSSAHLYFVVTNTSTPTITVYG